MNELDFNSENLEQKLKDIRGKAVRLSSFRLAAFLAFGVLVILGIAEHPVWLIPALATIWLFISLIQKFNAAKDQEAIYLAVGLLEARKQSRQNRTLGGLDEGTEFAEKSHPFSGDLDLFGSHSLFQLLNHATSHGGRVKLANLLKSEFSVLQAQKRQAAVSELREKPTFLRAMEAVGLAFSKENPLQKPWSKWVAEPERVTFLHQILAGIGPVGGVTLLVLAGLGVIPQALLGIWIIMGVLVLSLVFRTLKRAADHIPSSSEMKSMSIRSQKIEKENFHTEILGTLQSRFFRNGTPVSRQIQHLDRLGLWVQNRLNLLYLPINLLFWTDFLLVLQLAHWKKKSGDSLQHLSENLEEFEVWVSLGSFEVEVGYPGEVKWVEEKVVAGENVSHPLILPAASIPNSLVIGEHPQVILLTGANMSGKTTFMRTLGINAVLVNLGLRPFADQFKIGAVQLYTSMRNSDNLGESVSSFYAELNRIRTLITRLESGEAIFFLLDEILKGTNTQDRISGSRALIAQILQTKGFGIISTHDIELAELEQTVEKIHNFSFHSEIQDQTIRFDYKLKKGPCPSFNAHKLMELMGIKF